MDRDGTLIEDVGYVSDPARVRVLPGVAEALRRLAARRVPILVVTNQSGIGRGRLDRATFDAVQREVEARLAAEGARLDAVYVCPHAPEDGCRCRKPRPGLFDRAAAEHGVALERALFVGDRVRDISYGLSRGGNAVLVRSGEAGEEVPPGVRVADGLATAVAGALDGPPGMED